LRHYGVTDSLVSPQQMAFAEWHQEDQSTMEAIADILNVFVQQFLLFLPKLIAALVIFFVSLYASVLAARAVKGAMRAKKVDPELSLLLARITRISVLVVGTVIALQQVDFNLTGFLAGVGIIGFTIGFAIQDVTKNLVAGMLLLWQQPFDIGDSIEVSGYAGTVTNISMRATEIRTADGIDVIIPNGDVYVSAIRKYSDIVRRRVALSVGVACDSDLDLVTRAIEEALATIPGVITDDPAPKVMFEAFGESSIDLTAYYWVDLDQIGYFDGKDQGIRVVKTACEQAGIDLPYPTRTLLMPQKEV
jgi:small conductance mechanosensitive channel